MNIRAIASTYCPPVLQPALARLESSPLGIRLARGICWSIAGTAISRGLMLLASITVARILGKTGFGELGMIQSTVGMFGVLAGFGLGVTATRFVAQYRRSDPERAGRIISLSWCMAIGTAGLMSLGLLVFAPWLAQHTIAAPHLAGLLRISVLILFLNALNGTQTGALSGFEAFRTIARVNLLVGLISFPVLLSGAWFGGLTGAVWALAANLGVNWLLNHRAVRAEARRHRIPLRFQGCSRETAVLWSFAAPAAISAIMAGPVCWACKGMLARQPDGYAALGAIAAAESWRLVPIFVCAIVAQANLPILAQLYGDGQKRQFKKVLLTQFYLTGLITCLGALTVSVLAKPIMNSYGAEFRNDHVVLILTALSTIPMQLTTVVGTANRCIGNVWWNVLLNGLWAAVYLSATAVLIKSGAQGLAAAALIAYSFQFLAGVVYLAWALQASVLRLETRPAEG